MKQRKIRRYHWGSMAHLRQAGDWLVDLLAFFVTPKGVALAAFCLLLGYLADRLTLKYH